MSGTTPRRSGPGGGALTEMHGVQDCHKQSNYLFFLNVGFWTLFDELSLVLGFCLLGLLNLGHCLSSTTIALEDNSFALSALSIVLFCSSILICIITSFKDIFFPFVFHAIFVVFPRIWNGYKVANQKMFR